MNKAIFITVRTSSSRLPQKALLEINGKKVIVRLIERVKRSEMADMVVLCTSELREDDILCQIAEKQKINYYRGSLKDKLARWSGAVEKFSVEFFVTADGDDLFCEPELIDLGIRQYAKTKADFIEGKGIVCGSFTYGIKGAAVKKVCQIKGTDDTEMMWVYFTDTGLFKTEELRDVPAIFRRPEIRMTLDYEDDFKFFKNIIEHFEAQNDFDFNLRDIVKYLDENPQVIGINQYLQEKYLANQKAKVKLILKNGAIADGKNT